MAAEARVLEFMEALRQGVVASIATVQTQPHIHQTDIARLPGFQQQLKDEKRVEK